MSADALRSLETLAVSLLFSFVFLRLARIRIFRWLSARKAASLGAGVSIAYVFVQLLPELDNARAIFNRDTAQLSLPDLYYVPVATMVGFLAFYSLSILVARRHAPAAGRDGDAESYEDRWVFPLHIAAFAAYAWMVSYLLVHSLEESSVPLALYSVAMVLHFLSVAHDLYREHGEAYDRIGGKVLALACPLGWAFGMLVDLPKPVVAILLGLVAGGVLANTMVSELPSEKHGRLRHFLIGAAIYTALLLAAH